MKPVTRVGHQRLGYRVIEAAAARHSLPNPVQETQEAWVVAETGPHPGCNTRYKTVPAACDAFLTLANLYLLIPFLPALFVVRFLPLLAKASLAGTE
jgi:hypothetical protein